ncbi:MAG: phosphoribosylaminoimidazolesuccinocarboxamide synthase [Armatimonadetes bacterium]|nr:phosphoribosylaminoimidazolesuccinocarboxamide synthase [Armatimonadota bacterium]
MSTPVLTTDLPGLPRFATGKVRDVYDLGDSLLLVVSDRISAFDCVMPNGVPDKGRVLTQMSLYWFRALRPLVATHCITTDLDFICARVAEAGCTVTDETRSMLAGRSMLAVKAEMFPVECVVRGYLAGSLWGEYKAAGGPGRDALVHELALPAGLRECDKLPEPILTPSTKAETGHDMNIGMEEMRAIVGPETAARLAEVSVDIYKAAADRALTRGIIIADTKFELGLHKGSLTLADEALTPDSSRFWDAGLYEPGRSQPSFDKQYLRDWLTASGWNKEPPAPSLPDDVVQRTADKYREAYQRITGFGL